MNPVTEYIKNLGKSVKYATVAHLEEKAPAASSFVESNQELYKEAFHAIRDYKNTFKRTRDAIQNSAIYRVGDSAFSNSLDDIRSGKLYNKDREDASFDGFGSFEDASFDDNFGSDTSNEDSSMSIGSGDQFVAKSVSESSRKNAYAVTNAVASSAQYMADTNKSIANMQYVQATKMAHTIQTGLSGVSAGIDALYKFNTDVVSAHAENSKRFFESTTGLLQEQNAILKEMIQMQREKYKVETEKEKERKADRFDDIFNANGIPDIKAYAKAIGGNFKNAANDQTGGMLSMLSEENLKMFAGNPLSFIPTFLVSSLMGPKLNTAIEKFDDTLTGMFTTMTAKFNKMSKDENANPFEQFIGKVFGLKNTIKSSIDTSKYEKGAIDFNGITQKSIVEVMPGHLRRIEALLSGQNERFYDYNSGKWTNAGNIKQSFKNIRKDSVNSSMSDVADEMKQMMGSVSFKGRDDKESFLKDMQAMFEKIYDNHGYYNPHEKKDGSNHIEYGVSSPANMKILNSMYENLRRGTTMKVAGNVQSRREAHNRQMENYEKEGHSLYGNLSNDYGMDSHLKIDDLTKEIKERYGNLGDKNNILKVVDPYKKNMFDYLRDIYQELFIIRKSGGIGSVSAGSGRDITTNNNRMRNTKLRGGINDADDNIDYSSFKDKDWDSFFKSKLGPKEKSKKQIDLDQEAQKNEYYNRQRKEMYDRAIANGMSIAEADKWMDDTSKVTGAINVNATNRNIRDDQRRNDSNSTWLSKMMDDGAKKAKANLEENADGSLKEGMSFLDQLINAGSLGAKYDVIRNGISNLTAKPADLLTGVLTKADANIYDFFYGKETGLKDENGNKIKGFFNRMVFELKGTFGKVNTWLDDSVFKPFKDKFGGDTVWSATKGAIKKTTGVDLDEMYTKAKGFFVGDDGILQPTIDAVKNAYNEAYEEIKRDVQKSYKDANEFYNNQVLGEQTKEQKLASAKKNLGVENITESDAYRYALKRSNTVKNHEVRRSNFDELEAKLLNEYNNTTDDKRRKAIQSRLDDLYKNTDQFVDDKVSKYESRKNKIEKTSKVISRFKPNAVDNKIEQSKNSKKEELAQIKSKLNISGNLSDINIDSPDYLHIKDSPEASLLFNSGLDLEKEIPGIRTRLDRLKDSKKKLESEQSREWEKIGSKKENVLNDPNLIVDKAKGNKSRLQGQVAGSYTDAVNSLASLLGLAISDPQAKVAYKTVEELSKSYKNSTRGLGAGDAVKNLKVQINIANSNGEDSSSLLKQLDDVIAAKGALLGRFTNSFSNALGKMGVREDQIGPTIQSILSSHQPEELEGLNSSVKKFIEAAKKANPVIAPQLQLYSSGGINNSRLLEGDHRIENVADISTKYGSYDEDLVSKKDQNYYDMFKLDLASGNAKAKRSDFAYSDYLEDGKYSGRARTYSGNTGGERASVNTHYDGARNISKSGLTIVSKGEAIIPSDVNPFNPDLDKADRNEDRRNENRIRQRIGKSFDVNDIAQNADGSTSFGTENNTSFSKLLSDTKEGASNFFGQLFGIKDTSKILTKTNEEVRKHLPKGIAGGLLGGTIGLLTGIGGPLLGAIAGSAISVVSNSETLQKNLFGEKVYDSEGNETGNRTGGLFSNELQQSVKKYLPDAKTYGIGGTVLGMLTPLGPLGGLMMGSAISFVKHNETARTALFGKTGLVNEDTQKLIKKAFPNVAAAAVAGMVLGPFGILGNATIGAGLGLVSTTDEFKDFMLGKADAKGKRTGGLAGALKNSLVDPLASFASTMQSTFFNFVKRDIFSPIKRSIMPIGKQISLGLKDTMSGIGKTLGYFLKTTLGIPVINTILAPFKKIANKVSAPAKWLADKGMSAVGKVVSSPFKGLEKLADKAREHHISKSNADYMTASERLEFMGKRNKDYELKDYDKKLAGSKKEDLEKLYNSLGALKDGRKFLDDRHEEYVKDLSGTVLNKLDAFTARSLLKAAHNGNMEEVHRIIQDSDLSTSEKEKLAKEVNSKSEKVRDIKFRRDNYTKDENTMYQKLKEEHGITGINKGNLDKYQSVLTKEIDSRREKSKAEGVEEEQMATIESSLDSNTNRVVEFLKEQTSVLIQIRDNFSDLHAGQKAHLSQAKTSGNYEANKNKAINESLAHARNKTVSDLYGEDIHDRHKYNLADNTGRYKTVTKLAKKGRKLEDINTALDYNDDQFKRFTDLTKAGYTVKNYDKIAKLSPDGWKNVLAITRSGMKITNIDAIVSANEETVANMVKLYKAGFTNVSQTNLMKMAKTPYQYLDEKDKAIENMNKTNNVDNSKGHSAIQENGRSNIYEYDSPFQKARNAAGEILSEVTAPARDTLKGAKDDITKVKDLVADDVKNRLKLAGGRISKGFKELKGYADGTSEITKGGLAIVSKGERIEPAKDSKPSGIRDVKHVNTEYGIESYTKTTDGSMRLSNTKDNQDITNKIESRDNTQKGILENLKILAGTAKNKVGGAVGSAKETAKGGILGALSGLLGLFKMPLNILKSIGSLAMMPLEMLGLGGVAKGAGSWLGNKAMSMSKGAMDWAGNKVGDGTKWATDKIMGTKLGQKVSGKFNALTDRFNNSKVGKFFNKGKSLLGGGDGQSSPVSDIIEEPTDMVDAINVNRTSTVEYLKLILEAIQNGGGSGSSTPGVEDINKEGKDKTKPSADKAKTKTNSKWAKYAKRGAIGAAVAGTAYLGYKAFSTNSDGYQGNENPTDDGSDKTVGTVGMGMALGSRAMQAAGGMSPTMIEQAQVFIAKVKDGLKAMVAKLGSWIPNSKVYGAVQEFCGKLMEKLSTPKVLTKVVEKLGAKLALGPAYAAGLATGGVGAVVLGAAESVGWFLNGWSNADEVFGIPSGSTTGMKFAAGLLSSVLNMIPIVGIVIPEDSVMELVINTIGPVFGFGRSDIDKLKNQDTKSDSNTQNSTNGNDSRSNSGSFLQNAWDSTKRIGKEVVDKASNMWDSAKNTVSNWWDNLGKGKSGNQYGTGKFGRSSSLLAGFNSQLDPANAMNFNAPGDTVNQTMKDSGCGPVSATNMASALGINIDPKDAAKYALSKGYKEKDGGTEPGYFGDLLGKYGVGTEKVNSQTDIKANLSQGNPVLLMGKDGRGVSSKNPYGEYNHYVVGTGMDDKGNIIVQDPESNTPDKRYKANEVLNKSSMAIAASKGGFGKFSRGKWGRGQGDLSPEHMWALSNWVGKKVGMKPELVYGQWYHESGGFSSELAKSNYNFGGMTQSKPTGDPSDKQPDGSGYYMHFGSPEEWAEYYSKYILKCDGVPQSQNVQQFAKSLKDNGYYGASVDEYINGVSGGISNIPGKYDESLIDKSKFGKSQDNSKDSSTKGKKNGGFFGQLAELSDVMGSAFNLATSNVTGTGKYGRSKWGRSPDATQNTTETQSTQTAQPDEGLLGGVLSKAKQMAGTMQQALSPLAGSITSQAGKIFGSDKIKMIFGDNNPFSSIFGSKDGKDKKGNSGKSDGSFTSTSTNEGIRKASTWANQLVNSDEQQPYGPNGCTAFAKDYLSHAGNKIANSMSMWTPTLMEQAKEAGLWKDPSQGAAEGDVALIETNNKPSDGPDHVVIADGKDGYFGNSSSTLKVKHGPMAGTWGSDKIYGYIATGSGDGKVITGEKNNGVDVAAEAGPTSKGKGKYGMGKFGRSNTAIPDSFIEDYNRVQDDDSLDVQRAKNAKNNELWGSRANINVLPSPSIDKKVESNIIDINAPKESEIKQAQAQQKLEQQQAKKAQQVAAQQQPIDYTEKYDTMISLLGVIAAALTGQSNNTTTPKSTTDSSSKVASILKGLSSMSKGNNSGDEMSGILSVMNSIVAKA